MNFVNIKQFAEMKKCSRENVYTAERKGEIDIDRSAGFPIVHLSRKNLEWKPKEKGRPKKDIIGKSRKGKSYEN